MLAQTTHTIPLKYENRAFFYLTGMWPACGGFRRIDSILAPNYGSVHKFREGVLLVDRCLINRRPLRAHHVWQILDSGAGFDDLTNSFITHVPGAKPYVLCVTCMQEPHTHILSLYIHTFVQRTHAHTCNV